MNAQQLREVIARPAQRAGLVLEPGLVEIVLADLGEEPGSLPLLSHALSATWENRSGRTLTCAGYRDAGGVRKAIGQTADAVYARLTPTQQTIAKDVFVRLTALGEGTEDTRRRVSRTELLSGPETPQTQDVLNALASARLITLNEDSVEVAHEALIREWPRLRGWLDGDRDGLRLARGLTIAAHDWMTLGQDEGVLYRGARLVDTRAWVQRAQPRLSSVETNFLTASILTQEREERESRRRTRRLRQLVALLSVLLLVAFTAVVLAVQAQNRAIQAQLIALQQRNLALALRATAEATLLRGSDPALAAQLSLIAYRAAPIVEARSNLLNIFSGPTVTRVLGATDVRQTAAFTRNGNLMATGGADAADPSLRLWSLADRHRPQILGRLSGPTGAVLGLAFSPDGRTLISSGEDQKIWIWNVTNPSRPTPLGGPIPGPGGTVLAIDYSADGRTLAVGGTDKTIRLYDSTNPAQLIPLGGLLTGTNQVQSVAFSPNSMVLAAGEAVGTVRLWNVANPASPTALGLPFGGSGSVFGVAFSPDGRTLATAGDDKTVQLWNVADPAQPLRSGDPLTGPIGRINFVAFSADGHTLAAASSDNKAWVWDLATRRASATLPHPGLVTMVQFLDKEGTTLASVAADGTTRIWSLPAPVITDSTSIAYTAMIGSDGRSLLIGHDGNAQRDSTNQKVRLWDIADPRRPVPLSPPMAAVDGGGLSGAAALSPDRRTVAAGTITGPVYLWDVSDPGQPVRLGEPLIGSTSNIESVAFTRDGKTLAVGSDDTTVRLWNIVDPKHPVALATLNEPAGEVKATTFSDDGRLLAAASADSKVWLWDISNRERPFVLGGGPLTGFKKPAYSVTFSRDGRTLAAGSEDQTVRLWDLNDPRIPTPLGEALTGPNNSIYWLTFNPDMRLLAIGGGDGTVWIWDLTDRRQPITYATLTALPSQMWYVSFSPDGHTLATGSSDATVRLWETDPEAVARYICATTGDSITTTEWNQYFPYLRYDPPCHHH